MHCPMAVLQPGRDFAWFPFGNDISLSTWRRLLLFRRLSAGRKPDSAITTPRFVVRKFPVTALPSWFSNLWSSSHRFFTPAPSLKLAQLLGCLSQEDDCASYKP